jgi:8-oxo-dGTP diphosphatase
MAGVAFAVEGDGVGFATESYASSALYTTLASLSGAIWRIRRASRETLFAMQDQIARTVGALFISSDGKVLLGLRAASKKVWPRHWDTIGGRVEDGESLDEALIREVQEEVGVTPTQFRRVASVRERWPEAYGQALHHIYAVTEWKGGEPTNVCDEHTEIRWFTIEEMLLLTSIVDCDYPRYSRLAIDPRPTIAETPRIRLRCWRDTDRDAFATMQEDPDVMRDRGGPLNRQQSDAKFDRYTAAFEQHGFTRLGY